MFPYKENRETVIVVIRNQLKLMIYETLYFLLDQITTRCFLSAHLSLERTQMILDEEYILHTLSNHTLLGKVIAKALGLSQMSLKNALRQKFSSLYTA